MCRTETKKYNLIIQFDIDLYTTIEYSTQTKTVHWGKFIKHYGKRFNKLNKVNNLLCAQRLNFTGFLNQTSIFFCKLVTLVILA